MNNISRELDTILKKVEKPARYIGGEINTVSKDPEKVKARFAFAFPDTYEIGMSYMGMQLLYHVMNRDEDIFCERVFAPALDMEELMKESGMELFTLETKTPLKEMDLTPEKVREILKIAQEPVSLETPIGEEDDSHLGDFIEDSEAQSPSDHAAYELLKEQLEDVLDTLTDREENVLRLRFGLDDGRTRTLEEVGKVFGVTRERIRQIEAKALRKLRHPSRSKRLKDFLE